jgi:hypothetical protein
LLILYFPVQRLLMTDAPVGGEQQVEARPLAGVQQLAVSQPVPPLDSAVCTV